MTIQNIAAAAKNYLDELEERSPRFWDDIGTDQVAAILRLISNVFFSMNQLAKETHDIDKSKMLNDVQLEKIMGILSELTDNFFPMAHTQDKLGNLRIINYRESVSVMNEREQATHEMLDYLRHIKYLNDQVNNLVDQLNKNSERMNQILNP